MTCYTCSYCLYHYCIRALFISDRAERTSQLVQQPDTITIEEVASSSKPMSRAIRKITNKIKKLIQLLPQQEINREEVSLFDMLWLLPTSVNFVPAFQKIPGGESIALLKCTGLLQSLLSDAIFVGVNIQGMCCSHSSSAFWNEPVIR
ncbi:hypothetical protein ZIOFF_070094 [Zingiber officinale]|uniref:Uncharacterized protein n=1 Tax=Zingiber officinale TaxID=94328 RepID=A0A8J5C532_ZINOF|nr:hypothetical protein ZIOFF_070094 [Zingiber officinale]